MSFVIGIGLLIDQCLIAKLILNEVAQKRLLIFPCAFPPSKI